jgi:excisionase family DNA binding protein
VTPVVGVQGAGTQIVGLLDYVAAAGVLGTSPRHVRKLVDERQIASVKVGNLVRLSMDDLLDYVERRRRPAV